MLHVRYDLCVGDLSTNETLGVEDCVGRVHSDLVLGGISDQTLRVGEGDERRCCSVTLIVGDDFDTVVLPDTDASTKMSSSVINVGLSDSLRVSCT